MLRTAQLAPFAMLLALSACATDPKTGRNALVNRTLVGAGAGAALGALAGQAAGGRAFEGAVVGSVVGGVVGGVLPPAGNRTYYRDTKGSCYYVDSKGRPRYVQNTRC